MKSNRKFVVVLVTAPTLKVARSLARQALSSRLVACVNLIPRIESHYWWQGRIERGTEVLMLCKTTTASLARFEELILSNHPYDTAEFVVLSIAGGAERYLSWINSSVAGSGKPRRP
jgi:periplasmic divalent cation tolerance protein